MKPEISVIMSVYNGEEYLCEAIDSVLSQTFKNFELIVIDDCSTDSTNTILNKYAESDKRVRVFRNEVNLRLPKSLNKAISLAEGKYIARMDADDICLPERLRLQYEFMEERGDVALSSCKFLTVKNEEYAMGAVGGRCDSDALKAMLLVTNPVLHPGVIGKAEVFKKLLYDTSLTCTEDLEIWIRMVKENLKIEILPEYLMVYRLHDKQITKTTLDRQHSEVLKIEKEYFSDLLEEMTEEQEEFYINGVYFRENIDVRKFVKFFKWIKKVNKKKKSFTNDSLSYAMLEILAEYKRCGLKRSDFIYAICSFNAIFLIKEIISRKNRASKDKAKCLAEEAKLRS